MAKKIGVLIGSLREESFCKKVAKNVIEMFPEGYEPVIVPIGDLAIYNQDFDDKNMVPEPYHAFRDTLDELDAFLFVTPEYNRSVPAVIKNALDVGSRPYANNKWKGKPAAIMSASIGRMGAFGASQHLRQAVTFLNMPLMALPEVYLANIASMLDRQGNITDESLSSFLQKFVNAFVAHIEKNS